MLPIVARELRVSARRRGTYWTRVGASSLAMLTMLWLLIVAAAGGAVAAQGKVLFEVLSSFAFAFALLVGAWLTSDCLSSEKREGTLGLLFLTDLKGYDVVLGKLASSSFAAFYSLLAIVPVLALALLIGGVSLFQVFRVALVLVNTMFFSLSVGLFVSTLSQNERKAMFGVFALIAFLTLFPGVVIVFCREMLNANLSDRAEALIMLPSPLLSFSLTFPWPKPPLPFPVAFTTVHVLSWSFLASASLLLTRVSHDRPKSARRENWSRVLRSWSYGAGEVRLRFRRAMLDRNAFSWLAARERLKPHFVWFFIAVLGVLWGWGAWKYPLFFADWEIAPALLFLVHGFVKVWFASEVCNRLVEDRRAGALELLLSSPLKVREIAEGQWLALRRQFFWLVVALLGVDCAFMLAGPAGLSDRLRGIFAMFLAGMLVLILDLATLRWVGMWLAISQSNLNRVLLGTMWRVLLLPWVICLLLFSSVAFFQFVLAKPISLSLIQMVAVWTLVSVLIDLTLWFTARQRFLRDFRILATPRFDLPAARPAFSWREVLKRFVRPPKAEAGEPGLLKSWLRRHWITASVTGVLVLITGILAGYRLSLKAEVRRELQAIRQRGEPVLRSDIDKWHPAVLESENAAMQLKPALGSLSMPGGIGRTNQALMQTTVERNAKALRIAHDAVRLPKSRIDSDWADFFRLGPQWQFWRIHQLALLLGMEANVHVENSDSTAALESIETIFGLAHLVRNEPLLDTQIRSRYVLILALNELERVLSKTSLTDAQLRQIQKTVANVEQESLDPNPSVRGLISERFRLIQFHEAISLGTATLGTGQIPTSELTRLQLLFGVQKLIGSWDRNWLAPHWRPTFRSLGPRGVGPRLLRVLHADAARRFSCPLGMG
ncbi:MAG: hypothetical protein L0Z50_13435 [Verrucomicrobiales bacterium]|nr:hypothetical protein [Verrucomicrobiales bacterium]